MLRLRNFNYLTLLALANLLCAGCASFNHDWKIALSQPTQHTQIEGPWQGSWHSDANGHTGKLRCVVTKTTDDTYRARFHARYGKLLSFGYTVTLNVQQEVDSLNFHGQANLGFLAGGVYYYDGHANGTNFFSNYANKYDHGTFQMIRP